MKTFKEINTTSAGFITLNLNENSSCNCDAGCCGDGDCCGSGGCC